jgi:hypothetical protein
MSRSTFHLEPVPPFRLDLTVWTLRRRRDNALDRWDGQTYRRVLPLPAGLVEVAFRTGGLALNSDPGDGMTRAPVFQGQSVARSGHLDKRKQDDVRCALRSDTPA